MQHSASGACSHSPGKPRGVGCRLYIIVYHSKCSTYPEACQHKAQHHVADAGKQVSRVELVSCRGAWRIAHQLQQSDRRLASQLGQLTVHAAACLSLAYDMPAFPLSKALPPSLKPHIQLCKHLRTAHRQCAWGWAAVRLAGVHPQTAAARARAGRCTKTHSGLQFAWKSWASIASGERRQGRPLPCRHCWHAIQYHACAVGCAGCRGSRH